MKQITTSDYDFYRAVHTRMPFSVTFPTLNVVCLSFKNTERFMTIRQFEDLIGYCLMHIDDVL